MFDGVLPALVTPFTPKNELDIEGLKRNIGFLVEGGVSGIVPCGTTGESATLSMKEHRKVIDVSVECSKVPVIAGTGSNNTVEAIELTKYAGDAGCAAALMITPYYNKPTDRGLIQHFTAVAEAVDIPIIVYNVPGRTSLNMKPEVAAQLAKVDNIVGIKEASGNLEQISRVIEMTRDMDFSVFSGDDALTLPIMALGGCGVISVAANVVPAKVAGMVDAFRSGNMEEARRLHFELAPLVRALFLETNPIPVKRACELLGLAAGAPRLPLTALGKDNEKVLRSALESLKVL